MTEIDNKQCLLQIENGKAFNARVVKTKMMKMLTKLLPTK